MIVAAVWIGVQRMELIALLLAIAFVLVAEMINSAIEGAIDASTTSFDPNAKLAKDIAAGAVLIASVTALGDRLSRLLAAAAHRTARLLDRVRDAPAEITLVALVLVDPDRDRDEGVDRPRHAAARRAAVRSRGRRVRRLDGGDVHASATTTASSSRRWRS